MRYNGKSLKWKDAARMASGLQLSAKLRGIQANKHISCETWEISHPDGGCARAVYVVWFLGGIGSVLCECRTPDDNAQELPCPHAAAAAEASLRLTIQDAHQDEDGGLVTIVTALNGPGYLVPVQPIDAV